MPLMPRPKQSTSVSWRCAAGHGQAHYSARRSRALLTSTGARFSRRVVRHGMVRSWLLFFASVVLGALAGCRRAAPSRALSATIAGGVGGNGSERSGSDAGDAPDFAVARAAATASATPTSGEACDTCPADCGACAGCPMGYADCNHNTADGCETPLNTPMNCGGCGTRLPAGRRHQRLRRLGHQLRLPADLRRHARRLQHDAQRRLRGRHHRPQQLRRLRPRLRQPARHHHLHDAGRRLVLQPDLHRAVRRVRRRQDRRLHHQHRQRHRQLRRLRPRLLDVEHDVDVVHAAALCTPSCAAPYSDCSDPAAPSADNGCETNGHRRPGRERQRLQRPVTRHRRGRLDDGEQQPHPAGGRHRHLPRAPERGLAHLLPGHVAAATTRSSS